MAALGWNRGGSSSRFNPGLERGEDSLHPPQNVLVLETLATPTRQMGIGNCVHNIDTPVRSKWPLWGWNRGEFSSRFNPGLERGENSLRPPQNVPVHEYGKMKNTQFISSILIY
jgi:hypothetical protein